MRNRYIVEMNVEGESIAQIMYDIIAAINDMWDGNTHSPHCICMSKNIYKRVLRQAKLTPVNGYLKLRSSGQIEGINTFVSTSNNDNNIYIY